ncbi:DUF4825 domain-containing protein [Brevibacillus invocatus]|uniref:DUF4825 domain-containing protein n=1 Tax=Brevibacillus invocatus TaxID=173959 RepID=UPI0020400A9E|nr:DUF4825 domain-containing protein [Brevibacillus invocatus]MCM3078772.1 DUF4825 domain-containing protein [Brevibacillus invocatus]MCM3428860.1 DUF4825 domain-containing protein [Brevibacillus invocatus]
MNRRNKAILFLLVIGVVLYGVIQGVVIPANEEKAVRYQLDQQKHMTHDLKSILPYKSKYMGDASNVINLFFHLPLNHLNRTYQLDSEQFKVEIKYQTEEREKSQEEVKQALLYNALAAFALIDNLQTLEFQFPSVTYQTSREQMEQVFGKPLADLLTEQQWKEIQEKWNDARFLKDSMGQAFGE